MLRVGEPGLMRWSGDRRPPISGGVLDGIDPSGTTAAATSYCRCTAAMAATDVAVALPTSSSSHTRGKSLATSDSLEGQSGSPMTLCRVDDVSACVLPLSAPSRLVALDRATQYNNIHNSCI